jgi:hypothetical protein
MARLQMNLKSQYRRGGIIAILLFMLTPAVATACTCALTSSTCDIEWKRGQIVFLGKVTAMDSIPSLQSTTGYGHTGEYLSCEYGSFHVYDFVTAFP